MKKITIPFLAVLIPLIFLNLSVGFNEWLLEQLNSISADLVCQDFQRCKSNFPRFFLPLYLYINCHICFTILAYLIITFSTSFLFFKFLNISKNVKLLLVTLILIFSLIFSISEVLLYKKGYKPGFTYLPYGFRVVSKLEEVQLTYSDSNGIQKIVSDSSKWISGYKINSDGFRSDFEFNTVTLDSIRKKKKIIMIIGDSFTEGCCVNNIRDSYVDLVNKDPRYCALNFGIGATDPLQYWLIIKNYLTKINPNLVIISFCMGNDETMLYRDPVPGIPDYFQTNAGYLSSRGPGSLKYKNETFFENGTRAYEHYLNKYSLKNSKKCLTKLFSYSRFTSISFKIITDDFTETLTENVRTDTSPFYLRLLDSIQQLCNTHNTKVIFTAIPRLIDIETKINIPKKYNTYYQRFNFKHPKNLVFNDYLGYHNEHYNESGHLKHSKFVIEILENEFKK